MRRRGGRAQELLHVGQRLDLGVGENSTGKTSFLAMVRARCGMLPIGALQVLRMLPTTYRKSRIQVGRKSITAPETAEDWFQER